MVEECRSCLSIHFLFLFSPPLCIPRENEQRRRERAARTRAPAHANAFISDNIHGGIGAIVSGGRRGVSKGWWSRAEAGAPRPRFREMKRTWFTAAPLIGRRRPICSLFNEILWFAGDKVPCRVLVPVPTRQRGPHVGHLWPLAMAAPLGQTTNHDPTSHFTVWLSSKACCVDDGLIYRDYFWHFGITDIGRWLHSWGLTSASVYKCC